MMKTLEVYLCLPAPQETGEDLYAAEKVFLSLLLLRGSKKHNAT